MRLRHAAVRALWLVALTNAAVGAGEPERDSGAQVERRIFDAWRTVRVIDCARCHGADFDGSAAPSILSFARTQSKDRFIDALLSGNPPRGMPGYASVAPVRQRAEAIYDYFFARAIGLIPAGKLTPQASAVSD